MVSPREPRFHLLSKTDGFAAFAGGGKMLPQILGALVKPGRGKGQQGRAGRVFWGPGPPLQPGWAPVGPRVPRSPPVPAAPGCYFGLFLSVGCGTARVTAGSRVTFLLRVYFFFKKCTARALKHLLQFPEHWEMENTLSFPFCPSRTQARSPHQGCCLPLPQFPSIYPIPWPP